ncbi:hypothetical protein [Streptomyces sp. NPDC021622]|uniref:hypothetical protein n=1 Tax=Streptomyces sp. NPDC021622 TaxID=3155013 RepID=UPI0033F5B61E
MPHVLALARQIRDGAVLGVPDELARLVDEFTGVLEEGPRTDNPASATDADRYDNLAVYASRATGRDLSDFFDSFVTKWRFPITASGKARITALGLPKPTVDAGTYRE